MTENEAAAPVEGIDLSLAVEPDPAPEAEPTPAPEAQAQQAQSMAAIDLFAAELAKYPSPQEAKKHFKEISERVGCSSQLGYKATKKAIKNGAWKNIVDAPKPKQPTVKIEKAAIEESTEAEQETADAIETGTPTYHQTIMAPPEYSPSFSTYTVAPDVDKQQKDVIANQATKALNNVLDIVGAKTGAAGEKGEAFLDAEDSEALGVVIPILIKKATNGQVMTPELQENAVLACFAGNIVSKGIKNKLLNKPVQQLPARKDPPPQPAQEKPAEPAKPTPAPAPTVTVETEFKDHQPAYKRELR